MAAAPRQSAQYVRVLEVLERQELVASMGQLNAVGMKPRAVQQRCARRKLFRLHRAVYGLVPVTHLSSKGRLLAAVLACGPTAALSHRSAAHLHGLRPNTRATIDVIVPGNHPPCHERIHGHCSSTLSAADITTLDGIPVTTVARTALDLAAVANRRSVERALDQAEVLRTYDRTALTDQLARNPKHPGAPTLTAILSSHLAGTTVTFSDLEELCLTVSRAAAVPAPELNAFVDPGDGEPPIRPDFVWRAQKVVVEADGHRFHSTRRAFEDDRRRDQRLIAAGWRVIRVTYRQLEDESERIAAVLLALLTR
jgi:hypothetical protein